MSNWTHVAGIIRIDGYMEDDEFDKLFGKEVHFDAPKEVWRDAWEHPEKYLPKGSEGSLYKTVWENPNKNHLARYTVSIFGDLRDHEDPQEIVDWFEKICQKLGCFMVRNATITVKNDWNGTINKTFEFDDSEESK